MGSVPKESKCLDLVTRSEGRIATNNEKTDIEYAEIFEYHIPI